MNVVHRLADYRPLSWRIEHCDLDLDIFPDRTLVRSRLQVSRLDPEARALRLDGEGLKLLSLKLDDRLLTEQDYHIADGLHIRCDQDACVLESVVAIDPWNNTALEGFYLSGPMLCTQCEPEGFRRITWYQDRPDQLASFTTTLRADRRQFPVLLANGNRVSAGDLDDGRHFATFEDPTLKPSYLFACVAADLDVLHDAYVTVDGRHVALEIYAESRDIHQCKHAMQSLKNAMRWDEECYGRAYDLDVYVIVAVGYFNMGAMENKGLNIFNTSCVLATPELSTDAAIARVESVIAHEYFHNWTGNRITCRDWFQLCLKEGLTVYRDQQFSASMHSAAVERIDQLSMLRSVQFAEDAGPRSHAVRPSTYSEINNFYTATVYEKGAEIVRMMHWVLGDQAWRKGMDTYFDRHDGQAVTVEDFLAALSDGGGVDLSAFMVWYEQPGTPVLGVEEDWNPETGHYQLRILLKEGAVRPLPIRVGILGADGVPLAWTSTQHWRDDGILMRSSVAEIQAQAPVGSKPPVPVLLRGFSAPVRVERPWSVEELALVICHESDPVSRWLAMQDWWIIQLRQFMENTGSALSVQAAHVLEQVMIRAGQDPALAARMLQLPSLAVVAMVAAPVDPERWFAGRRALQVAIGKAHDFQPWLEDLHHEDAGHRALAEMAWHYHAAGAGDAVAEELWDHYQRARTMTARQACVSPMYYMGGAVAMRLRSDWERRFSKHPLVMDRWFSLQAGHPATSLDHVKALLEHQRFDWLSPNRVRAVLFAFAQSNPEFHRRDGQGYRLLLEAVARLDRQNPQLAARLMSALDSVTFMPPAYADQVRACVRHCLSECQSSDVLEMRAKWLD